MPHKPNYKTIASKLINAEPLSFKDYPDGSLVVIAPTGQKFTFLPDQIQAVSHSIAPENDQKPSPTPKPELKSASKTSPKRGRPSKAKPKSE